MGNLNNKTSLHTNHKQAVHSVRDGQTFTSQFSLSHFVGNLSGRSFASVTSNQSVYSASRPWSRISRRRWNDATLNNPLEASKTAWPVAHKESIFLPEFPITTDLLQKDFEIAHTIAKGAFGEVYKVKKLSENKEYALKVLNKSQVVNDNAVRQVKEEARIQEAVGHHVFIAGSVSRWQTKKRLYIVSDICYCVMLSMFFPFPDFLHNAGIIYRDLKPENILLDKDYHIRLIDFGLSKWLSIGSRTTTICGTLKYMAPELMMKEPYSHAVDWWSLGVLACYMLTGEFPTPVLPRQANATSNGNPPSSNDVNSCKKPGTLPECADLSKAARTLLMRLLETDPRHRMRSLRTLQQSAFYMNFNFEHIKSKKITPKHVLEQNTPFLLAEDNKNKFIGFDQP
nr:serine/threonine-protein kinase S6KL [Danaus plexippus plexippus]